MVLVLLAFAASQSAEPGKALAKGLDNVIVFKSQADFKAGFDLIVSGLAMKRPEMLAPLVACVVDEGTPLYRSTGSKLGTAEVLVTDGPDMGCKGVILLEQFGEP